MKDRQLARYAGLHETGAASATRARARGSLSFLLVLAVVLIQFPGGAFAQAKPFVGDTLPPPTAKPGCKLVGSGGTGPQQKVFEVCPGDEGEVRTEVDPEAIPEGTEIHPEPIALEPSQAGDVAKGVAQVGEVPAAAPEESGVSTALVVGGVLGLVAIAGYALAAAEAESADGNGSSCVLKTYSDCCSGIPVGVIGCFVPPSQISRNCACPSSTTNRGTCNAGGGCTLAGTPVGSLLCGC